MRIITDNAFCYENVKLIDYDFEQTAKGIKKYITDTNLAQIVLETDDGKTRIISDGMIGVIEYCKMKPPHCAKKIEKIVINGEISYGPCWLLEIEHYKKYKIPRIFKHQLTFISDNTCHICHQEALIEIVL